MWAWLLQCALPAIFVLLLHAPNYVGALKNGVGQTPAMGWNSWNFFRCNINETLIKQVADAMVSSGLRDAGYVYVNLDDCWMEKRGPDGRIIPFKDKFPSGMKALADYIHSKGLKFGVYSDAGNHTCEGYPGSWGYEKQDAQTYAEWGVDYLKYDYCGMEKANESVRQSYERMRDALLAAKRPILYSLCSWGSGQPHLWGQEVGNSWRTGIDVFAVWDEQQAKRLKLPNFLQPILNAIKTQEEYSKYAGPGGFNDPDMLVVGLDGMYPYGIVQDCPEHVSGCTPGMYISRERWGKVGGLTHTEQRTHFSFWCMLSSPLILGNDPRQMSKATLQILLAKEVIAISQDKLAKQGTKAWKEGDLEVWVKELYGGKVAVLLFNRGSQAADISLDFARDLPQLASKWAREVKSDVACEDRQDQCRKWASAGECERNPGFMLDVCKKSCPAGCPKPKNSEPQASAVVRDAWLEEDQGVFTGRFVAKFVEPHEARLVTLTFGEVEDLKALLSANRQRAPTVTSSSRSTASSSGSSNGGSSSRGSVLTGDGSSAATTATTARRLQQGSEQGSAALEKLDKLAKGVEVLARMAPSLDKLDQKVGDLTTKVVNNNKAVLSLSERLERAEGAINRGNKVKESVMKDLPLQVTVNNPVQPEQWYSTTTGKLLIAGNLIYVLVVLGFIWAASGRGLKWRHGRDHLHLR